MHKLANYMIIIVILVFFLFFLDFNLMCDLKYVKVSNVVWVIIISHRLFASLYPKKKTVVINIMIMDLHDDNEKCYNLIYLIVFRRVIFKGALARVSQLSSLPTFFFLCSRTEYDLFQRGTDPRSQQKKYFR